MPSSTCSTEPRKWCYALTLQGVASGSKTGTHVQVDRLPAEHAALLSCGPLALDAKVVMNRVTFRSSGSTVLPTLIVGAWDVEEGIAAGLRLIQETFLNYAALYQTVTGVRSSVE